MNTASIAQAKDPNQTDGAQAREVAYATAEREDDSS